jgi:hypothetical protein
MLTIVEYVCTFLYQAGRRKQSICSMGYAGLLGSVEIHLILLEEGLEAVECTLDVALGYLQQTPLLHLLKREISWWDPPFVCL